MPSSNLLEEASLAVTLVGKMEVVTPSIAAQAHTSLDAPDPSTTIPTEEKIATPAR
jgi:hypothetical protein